MLVVIFSGYFPRRNERVLTRDRNKISKLFFRAKGKKPVGETPANWKQFGCHPVVVVVVVVACLPEKSLAGLTTIMPTYLDMTTFSVHQVEQRDDCEKREKISLNVPFVDPVCHYTEKPTHTKSISGFLGFLVIF